MLMELDLIGAPVDSVSVHKLDELYDADIKELRQKFVSNNHVARLEADQGEPFNPNSFRQIGRLLFEYMGLPVQGKTATGNPSTDADTLKALACKSDVPGMILSLRKLGKMRGTSVTSNLGRIKSNGRLRGNFNLCSTTSGRLSSSGDGD